MGSCKALLPHPDSGAPLARALVDAFIAGGLDEVIVTAPDDADDAARVRVVVGTAAQVWRNDHPSLGLTGSLLSCLDRRPHIDALVLCPVDNPFADGPLVARLARAVETAPAAVVEVDGVRGHPVAFSRAAFPTLRAAAPGGGPRAALAALGARIAIVAAHDARLTASLNTPAEWQAVVGAVRRS